MTARATAITAQDTEQHLRKMSLGEFDRFTELIETAFAEDQAREGRSFRDEVRGLKNLMPFFRIMFAIIPGMEKYFYTLVWDADDRFAAAVTISRQGSDPQRWYIANVATHPAYRGCGLARTLVSAALDRIRAQGGRYALLLVRADNEPAYRLYRSLGFLHLETSTTLKGVAQPIDAPALPAGYTLRSISQTDWQTRLTIAQQLASPETRSVCPPTAKRFQEGKLGRGLEALMSRAQHLKSQAWAVVAADQPIGLVRCRIHRSGPSPHNIEIEIASEHLDVAQATIAHAINYCVEERSDVAHPVLINLNGQPEHPIGYLRDHGFTPIETVHELGLKVL